MFFRFPPDARWNAEQSTVEFGVGIGEYEGVARIPRRVFQRLLGQTPTPERCLEAYHLHRTRLELIAERKLRRRQLTDDGNIEITGRDLHDREHPPRDMRVQTLMRLLALTATLLLYAVAASAADPNPILGQWIERFPNGRGMVTEFKPDSMESYIVDPSGKRLKDVGNFSVTYKNLDPSTIGINFKGGGGVMVIIKDSDTLILDFPGMGDHTLKKQSAQPTG
jgi:hypothetical protein